MTPDKKRVQMLKLDKGLFEMKMCFNQKFFSLRERKKGICSTIQRMNKRLMEINTKLGIQGNFQRCLYLYLLNCLCSILSPEEDISHNSLFMQSSSPTMYGSHCVLLLDS